jgi:hypothetical protein
LSHGNGPFCGKSVQASARDCGAVMARSKASAHIRRGSVGLGLAASTAFGSIEVGFRGVGDEGGSAVDSGRLGEASLPTTGSTRTERRGYKDEARTADGTRAGRPTDGNDGEPERRDTQTLRLRSGQALGISPYKPDGPRYNIAPTQAAGGETTETPSFGFAQDRLARGDSAGK